jgi:hypothetical protein
MQDDSTTGELVFGDLPVKRSKETELQLATLQAVALQKG